MRGSKICLVVLFCLKFVLQLSNVERFRLRSWQPYWCSITWGGSQLEVMVVPSRLWLWVQGWYRFRKRKVSYKYALSDSVKFWHLRHSKSFSEFLYYVIKWEASSQMKDQPHLAWLSWNSARWCHGLLVGQESKLLNGVCFVVIQQVLDEHRLAPSGLKSCQDVCKKKKQRRLCIAVNNHRPKAIIYIFLFTVMT